jgi:DNA-binding HxlR family transcriptional regulator
MPVPTNVSARSPWTIQRAIPSPFELGGLLCDAQLSVVMIPRVRAVTLGNLREHTHHRAPREGGTLKSLGNGRLTRGFDADCIATREILNRVGDKWSVLVVVILGERRSRFNELKRALDGISQRMLTVTLRGLERDGLVKRTVHPTNPPQVEYELTKLGRTLLEPVSALAVWAQGHRGEVQRARDSFDHSSARRRPTP